MRWWQLRKRNADLERELQSDFDLEEEEQRDRGVPPEEAGYAARRAFGNSTLIRERTHEAWGWAPIEHLAQDLRFALRQIRRSPGFAIAVIVTLALGIGSTSAVFSVVDRILFRPLPYADPDRLVSVGLVAPIEPQEFMLGGSYYDWQDNQRPFAALTSETGTDPCDLNELNPVRLTCARVEQNFLPTLGVSPLIGRNFLPTEDRPSGPRVALISHALWRARFHQAPAIIGRIIRIDEMPTEIIGVLPAGFEMPRLQPADILVPEALDVAAQRRANPGRPLWAFARLKPGVTPREAMAELEPLFQYSLSQAPAPFRKEVHFIVRPLRDRQFHVVHRAAWLLFDLVLAVLLVACANVASLLTARGAAREHEMAVRAAIGAGRLRLLQQALAESLILSGLGAAGGILLAAALLRLLVAVAPDGMPFLDAARIDVRVLVLALTAGLVCALVFTLLGSLSRARIGTLIGRASISTAHARLRQALVITQMAASFFLLSAGFLLARSFVNIDRQSLGLDDSHIFTASITLSQTAYQAPGRQMQFFQEIEQNLRYGPGILAIAISDSVPPGGPHHDQIYASLRVQGQPRFTSGTGGNVAWRWVTPGYFRALQIPMVSGTGFADDELASPNHFVILSRSLAQRLFPAQDALGKQVHLATGAPEAQDPPYTVVGVAADVKNGGLAAGEEPEYYRLLRNRAEDWGRSAVVILKSSQPPAVLSPWIRTQVAALDPTLPVQIETLRQRVEKLAGQPRFEMLLVGYFAFIGLVLAVVGLYGVMSFLTVERKPEVGIRMALGASPRHIAGMVLGGAMRMVIPGTVIGIALSLALSRLIASLLYQVGPRDPAMLLGASAVLIAAALVAAAIPAFSAARVDPARTLRTQ